MKSSPAQPNNFLTGFLAAVQFLLMTPAFVHRPFTPQEMGLATAFYPVVGALLGAILILVDFGLSKILPVATRSTLLLALWVILTGALHLDGFLDACDGLLGGFSPESRLEIMRDERIGAFALAGGVLLFAIQLSALNDLNQLRLAGLLLAPVLGRWGMSLAIVVWPYARLHGLGKDIKAYATRREAAWSTGLMALIVGGLSWWMGYEWAGLAVSASAVLVLWAAARFTLKRIPGLTGDIYGAINLLIETAVLVTLVVFQTVRL